MLESLVERYLRSEVVRCGGYCLKFVSPGNAGVPDRLVIIRGDIYLIELKAPGKQPRRLQSMWIRKLAQAGCNVRVIDCKQKVDEFIDEVYS